MCASACVEARTFTPLPPPEPILRFPSNAAYVGSTVAGLLEPVLSWEHPGLKEDEHYELQVSAQPSFDTLALDIQTSETSFMPDSPLEVSTTPPVGRRYYWQVRACIAQNCSDYSAVRWFDLGRSSNDFNGDGYSDVFLGYPGQGAGSIQMYLGRAGGSFLGIFLGALSVGDTGDQFGFSHAAAGDFNGDGYADLIVGAPGSDIGGMDAGRAYLYLGASSFPTNPSLALAVPSAGDRFGASVSGAGDVNSDGFADVVIGAPGNDSAGMNTGRTYIYFGGVSGPLDLSDGALSGDLVNGQSGVSVATAGDVNGDDVADVVVSRGDFANPGSSTTRCASKIYMGQSAALFGEAGARIITDERFQLCSMRAEGVGDVNGDGLADVAAAINSFDGTRTISLYLGSRETSSTAPLTFLPSTPGIIHAFSAVDDVNGDGLIDFVVSTQEGGPRTLVNLGQRSGDAFELKEVATLGGVTGLANAGDIDGDGFGDILTSNPSSGVQIFFGARGDGFDTTPEGTLGGGDVVLMKSLPARAR